jgi:hypothetical protein
VLRSLVKREVKTFRAVRQYRFTDEILTGILPRRGKIDIEILSSVMKISAYFLVTFKPLLTGFPRPCTGAQKIQRAKVQPCSLGYAEKKQIVVWQHVFLNIP